MTSDSTHAAATRNRRTTTPQQAPHIARVWRLPPLSVASSAFAHAAPSTTAPAGATSVVARRRSAALAAAAANLSAAKRSLAQAQRRAQSQRHHDALVGPSGAIAGSSAAREETPHATLGGGIGPGGTFSGASVFVVCKHGAIMGRANGIWQDFGGRRKRGETPYATAFREMREEIGLTAGHVGILHDQPTWVVHAGYRHAVFIATLPEANRVRTDCGLGVAETPELDEHRGNFVDFANFFSNDMHGNEIVHRRIKTREVFDLANPAYLGLCRAAHHAEAAADTVALADSDDDADDVGAPPPLPPQRQQPASATASGGATHKRRHRRQQRRDGAFGCAAR